MEPTETHDTHETPDGFLSPRPKRTGAESAFVRVVATAGIIAIGTALGAAIGAWTDISSWLLALVVSIVTVLLAAVLWRSREL
jgi:protein-S-isoprenylcysteine O-methyltransferase Ste14